MDFKMFRGEEAPMDFTRDIPPPTIAFKPPVSQTLSNSTDVNLFPSLRETYNKTRPMQCLQEQNHQEGDRKPSSCSSMTFRRREASPVKDVALNKNHSLENSATKLDFHTSPRTYPSPAPPLPGFPPTQPLSLRPLQYHLIYPYILSGYLQLAFNLFLLLLVLYLTVQFIRTVQRDVQLKVEEYRTVILSEISQCSKQYMENKCRPEERVPAMDKACIAWYNCMSRDPTEVSWTRISAETIAEIINGFVEPISYKTMIFFILFTFGLLFLSNIAFGVAKSRIGWVLQNHGLSQMTTMGGYGQGGLRDEMVQSPFMSHLKVT